PFLNALLFRDVDPAQTLLEHVYLLGWEFLRGELRILGFGIGKQLIKFPLIAWHFEKLINFRVSHVAAGAGAFALLRKILILDDAGFGNPELAFHFGTAFGTWRFRIFSYRQQLFDLLREIFARLFVSR